MMKTVTLTEHEWAEILQTVGLMIEDDPSGELWAIHDCIKAQLSAQITLEKGD